MKKRDNNILVQDIEGETIIFDSLTGKIHKLNPVAQYVWKKLDDIYTIETIVEGICTDFSGCERSQVVKDVAGCIQQFQEMGLIDADT